MVPEFNEKSSKCEAGREDRVSITALSCIAFLQDEIY